MWCQEVDKGKARLRGEIVLERARAKYRKLNLQEAYPKKSDTETKVFIRYRFDKTGRRQLAALGGAIRGVRDKGIRDILWCAFSRLIIVKNRGVSLAMDVSHSRPHRAYNKAAARPFREFLKAVNTVLRAIPFEKRREKLPCAQVYCGDARELPLKSGSIDMVITSPPYLNAIDYLRGQKFSLVWMGHSIGALRKLRSSNIGTETCRLDGTEMERALKDLGERVRLPGDGEKIQNTLAQYMWDMGRVISEIARVVVARGKVIFVIGDSSVRGAFIRNSEILKELGKEFGLQLCSIGRRALPHNRRYLPPPGYERAGKELRRRMREEVILVFEKPGRA